jgi:iron complex outermembrane receptor protein
LTPPDIFYTRCNGRQILIFALGALLCIEPNATRSADASANDRTGILEEVLVTARRRDESATTVPMALTRLDGETLEGLQYRDLDEILSLSPGVLVYAGGDGVSPQITIRGVVTPGALVEPGNAVYVDDIYSSGMRTAMPGFYDIASVQVLKGPQAGLYGRNTMGGAVVIATRQPTEELSAHLDASYAQYHSTEVNGTVNVPLSQTARIRTTGWYSDIGGGYYENAILDQNLDSPHARGGRLTLALLPNEQTTVTLTGEIAEADADGLTGDGAVVNGALLGPHPLAPESRRNVLRDDMGGLKQDFARVNGKLDFDTTSGTIVAVAGWREIRLLEPGSDQDGTAYVVPYQDSQAQGFPPSPLVLTRDDRDSSVNAEVRFISPDNDGPLDTMVGVSYFGETARLLNLVLPLRELAQSLSATGPEQSFELHTEQDTSSWAGFAEVIWTPVESVEITTDLRYTHDRKDIATEQSARGMFVQAGFQSLVLNTSKTFENWSPGITLALKPDHTLTIYAKYVRGFRAGGFNTAVNNPALLPYDSEEAGNYELGVKTLLNQRVHLGASVFYLRIDNALVPQIDFGAAGTFFPLQNAGVAETTGLEVDLAAQMTDELSLTAAAGAYTNHVSNGGPVGLDSRPFVPDYTMSLTADYEHPLTTAITGFTMLGFRHRSGGRVPALSEIGMDTYNLLDLQLGMRLRQVEFAGFVRNALDNHYIVADYGLLDGQIPYAQISGAEQSITRATLRDPGTVYGIRLTMDF